MRKSLALVLTFVMVFSMITTAFVAGAENTPGDSVTVEALCFKQAPVLSGAITEKEWGKPTISVNADSRNAYLHDFTTDSHLSDLAMDVYYRWDADYLYIGVVTDDPDTVIPSKVGAPWKGDAIQFIIDPEGVNASGDMTNPFSGNAKNISFCLNGDGNLEIRNHTESRTFTEAETSYYNDNGTLHFMVKLPHTSLGLSAGEAQNGFNYGISLARVSSEQFGSYNGWLVWGAGVLDGATGRIGNNSVVLTDGSGTGGGSETTPSSLTNISSATNANINGNANGVKNGMKIVNTNNGVYAVYMTRSSILSSAGHDALNEFVLVQIEDNSAKKLYCGYTVYGDVDILSDANGEIYIAGGGSSFNQRPGTANEQAVLDVWHYNRTTGTVNGYTTRSLAFANATGHHYVTSMIDNDTNRIYLLFTEGTSLTWFSFDLTDNKWSTSVNNVAIDAEIGENYTFSTGNCELTIVYAADNKVNMVTIADASMAALTGSTLLTTESELSLRDVYVDDQNRLHVLYVDGSTSYHGLYSADGVLMSTTALEFAADKYMRILQNMNGVCHIIAMPEGAQAVATVLSSENGENFTRVSELDFGSTAIPIACGMIITAARNGSTQDGSVSAIFPALYRGAYNWYYFSFNIS